MFVSGMELSKAIQRVCEGDDVRIAVAFIGKAFGAKVLGLRAPEARIVCDLTMGGTNPWELRALGAPSNPNLRHRERLHAKVYLSSNGCVVGSANASDNGLGFEEKEPALQEAGVFGVTSADLHSAAGDYFESIWGNGEPINDQALKEAEVAWQEAADTRVPPPVVDPAVTPVPLQDALHDSPDQFGTIEFLFTSLEGDEEASENALARWAKREGPEFAERARGFVITGWGPQRASCGSTAVREVPIGRCHALLADMTRRAMFT